MVEILTVALGWTNTSWGAHKSPRCCHPRWIKVPLFIPLHMKTWDHWDIFRVRFGSLSMFTVLGLEALTWIGGSLFPAHLLSLRRQRPVPGVYNPFSPVPEVILAPPHSSNSTFSLFLFFAVNNGMSRCRNFGIYSFVLFDLSASVVWCLSLILENSLQLWLLVFLLFYSLPSPAVIPIMYVTPFEIVS